MPPAQAGPPRDAARRKLSAQLAPVVAHAGYDLEDLDVTVVGRRTLVRVVVDADGGVDLDGVAVVSRAVSDALDGGGEQFAGPYVLEVTSPGVDRPLSEPRHWRRAAGRLVQVTVDGELRTGRVHAVDDAGVSLELAGAVQQVPWAGLGRGKVQVEFNRPSAVDDDEQEG